MCWPLNSINTHTSISSPNTVELPALLELTVDWIFNITLGDSSPHVNNVSIHKPCSCESLTQYIEVLTLNFCGSKMRKTKYNPIFFSIFYMHQLLISITYVQLSRLLLSFNTKSNVETHSPLCLTNMTSINIFLNHPASHGNRTNQTIAALDSFWVQKVSSDFTWRFLPRVR